MSKLKSRNIVLVAMLALAMLVVGLAVFGCGSKTVTTTAAVVTETTSAPVTTAGGDATTTTAAAAGPATGTPYKIGILTTSSGPIAFLGKDIVATTQMEVDLINSKGGVNGHPIELVIEDDGMDPGKAVAGLTKLGQNPEILAVTGLVITGMGPAVQPVAERLKVPFIMTAPSLPDMRAQKPKYTFNDAADEINNAYSMVQILKMKNLKNVVGIAENDPLSIATDKEVQAQAKAEGITVTLLEDTVGTDAMDVTPQVNKLKALVDQVKADGVISTVWPNQVGTLSKTMKAAGMNLPIVCYSVVGDWSTLAMGGDELNGLLVPAPAVMAAAFLPDSNPTKAVVTDFATRYQAKFNQPAGSISAGAADEIYLIVAALKVSGPDREKLRDAIEATKDFAGPIGMRTITPDNHCGVQKGNFFPMEIVKKQFQPLQP
jgi:branched-chain amino acid transport system substrate-binding protein